MSDDATMQPDTPDDDYFARTRTTAAGDRVGATGDGGAAQLQQKFDEAAEEGYVGEVPDPNPNSAYSLESGPDSPSAVPDDRTRIDQHVANS